MTTLRSAVDTDYPAILRLNTAEEQHTSQMKLQQLETLAGMASYFKVATVGEDIAAFLIALQDSAPYENDNFGWFASRIEGFLYVDRVVVDARFSGRRIGSSLYEDLFAFARSLGIDTITCEYNIDPPNVASRAFHDSFGFRELGTQWVAGGTKRVSLQAATV